MTHSGTLVARTASSVTVKRGDHTLTCSRSDSSPNVQGATVGHKVKVTCDNGVLVGLEKTLTGTAAGTISALSPSAVTLHNDDGTVTCTLGDGSPKLGDYHVGDRVKLSCSEGVLTAIARLDPPADVQTGLGTVTALSDASVTVHTDSRDLTCTRGEHSPTLGEFHVGDRVKVACTNHVLTAMAKVTETTVTTITTGLLSALTPTSVSVLSDGGLRTCSRSLTSPSLDAFHLGDRVKMSCTNGMLTAFAKADVITDGLGVLTALSPTSLTVHTDGGDKTCSRGTSSPSLDGYQLGDTVRFYCSNGALIAIAKVSVTTTATGVLSALSPTSLTVHTDGGDKSCSRGTGSPSLDGYQVGDRVKTTCTNGVLTAIARADTPTYMTGLLTALSPSSLTVHTDGGDKTCSRTATSPSLDGYQVGNSVKAYCLNGALIAIAHL